MMVVGIVNFIVGLLVGVSGIAGFLLPIFYVSVMQLNTVEALALSFSTFIVSGVSGSINYHKAKLLNIKTALTVSVGSFAASFLGVKANLLIPEHIMQKVLYIVVFLSGLSILLRKNKDREEGETQNKLVLAAIGFVTGFICSLSGAGGPILVLPILIMLGTEIREAVAIALCNSIFIGIPAAVGYMLNSNLEIVKPILPAAIIFHGIGVLIGSSCSSRINQNLLKKSVAVFSILIASYKLFV